MTEKQLNPPTKNCFICGKLCYGYKCKDCFMKNRTPESKRRANYIYAKEKARK